MECKTLINILGRFNHRNIAAAINLKPEVIVFLNFCDEVECFDNVKECIKRKLPDARIEEYIAKDLTEASIREAVSKYNYEDAFFNLSGGTKLMSILAFKAAHDSDMTMIYVDTDSKKILRIGDAVEEIAHIDLELSVEDMVYSTGAEIIKNSTAMYDKEEFKQLIDFMVSDYDAWKQVKELLRNTRLVKQSDENHLHIDIITGGLTKAQIKHLGDFLSELSKRHLIKQYRLNYDHAQFDFVSREAKTFVMMSGCWLEALTYRYIKEAKDVKDAISGMLFVWDEAVKVHNELDVVAAVDSHLVCVSCKDTNKYDVAELNELEVYADHLGGSTVTKILVSTEKPERKEMTFQRADEMDIHIVIFDGDTSKFRNELHRIVNKAKNK